MVLRKDFRSPVIRTNGLGFTTASDWIHVPPSRATRCVRSTSRNVLIEACRWKKWGPGSCVNNSIGPGWKPRCFVQRHVQEESESSCSKDVWQIMMFYTIDHWTIDVSLRVQTISSTQIASDSVKHRLLTSMSIFKSSQRATSNLVSSFDSTRPIGSRSKVHKSTTGTLSRSKQAIPLENIPKSFSS